MSSKSINGKQYPYGDTTVNARQVAEMHRYRPSENWCRNLLKEGKTVEEVLSTKPMTRAQSGRIRKAAGYGNFYF